MIDKENLLFIEPSSNRTLNPVIDSLTRKITASLRKAEKGVFHKGKFLDVLNGGCYFGVHHDSCGCRSDSCDRKLTNNRMTNSLAIHYVAFHRLEIPEEQLQEILNLKDGEEDPTIDELWPSHFNIRRNK